MVLPYVWRVCRKYKMTRIVAVFGLLSFVLVLVGLVLHRVTVSSVQKDASGMIIFVEKTPLVREIAEIAGYSTTASTALPTFLVQTENRVERTRTILKQCRSNPFITKNARLQGFISRTGTLLYCTIPKVGTTFLTPFITRVMNYETSSTCFAHFDSIEDQIYERYKNNINDTFSFMFVRDPYYRLFSAYENKLFHPNEFWGRTGLRIIIEVRKKASSLSRRLGHDVTFAELVEYVVKANEQNMDGQLNVHLAPMHTLCDPCNFHFDFIGKLENMSDDIKYLLDECTTKGITSRNMKPSTEIEEEIRYNQVFGRVGHMFRELREHKADLSRYNSFLRTWSSYQIRGYIRKEYEMPFAEDIVGQIDMENYKQEVKKALDKSVNYTQELRAQREEAFIQAYRSVPLDVLLKLRNFMKPDCLLFGYDDKPDNIFKRESLNISNSFNYFKGL